MSTRPRVVLAVAADWAWRDLADSGALDRLAADFELHVLAGTKLSVDVDAVGPSSRLRDEPRWRSATYAVGKGLWHAHWRRHLARAESHALYRGLIGQPRSRRLVITTLHRARLSRPVGWAARWALRATAPSIPALDGVDAVLLSAGTESSFGDDVVRAARTAGVPVLAVQTNWDNVGTKTMYEVPSHHAVWGEQSALIAQLLHRIPSDRIWVTGSPRLDVYRGAPAQAAAREALGLDPEARHVLVAGSGMPFDEVSVLEALADAHAAGRLPADLRLLYKPHPARHARAAEPAFRERPPFLRLAPTGEERLTRLERYPALLSAVDAVLTPFSTMALEAAALGKPALLLGYDHADHGPYDWNRAVHELHLLPLHRAEWCVVCLDPDGVLDGVDALLALATDPGVPERARATAAFVARTGARTSTERLVAALADVAAGRPADRSGVGLTSSGRPRGVLPASIKDG